MALGVQFIILEIHTAIADRIEIIAPVEHAEPYLSDPVLIQAVDGEWRELGSIDKAVVQVIVTENAVFRSDQYFSFTQDLDTFDGTVLYRLCIFQQVVVFDYFPGPYIHQVDAVYHMAYPQVIPGGRQSPDIGV